MSEFRRNLLANSMLRGGKMDITNRFITKQGYVAGTVGKNIIFATGERNHQYLTVPRAKNLTLKRTGGMSGAPRLIYCDSEDIIVSTVEEWLLPANLESEYSIEFPEGAVVVYINQRKVSPVSIIKN